MFICRRGSQRALFAVALLGSLGLSMSCGVDKVKFRTGEPETTAVLVVSKTEVAVLEGGEATFTVALSRDPEGPVVVSLRASNDEKLAQSKQASQDAQRMAELSRNISELNQLSQGSASSTPSSPASFMAAMWRFM